MVLSTRNTFDLIDVVHESGNGHVSVVGQSQLSVHVPATSSKKRLVIQNERVLFPSRHLNCLGVALYFDSLRKIRILVFSVAQLAVQSGSPRVNFIFLINC